MSTWLQPLELIGKLRLGSSKSIKNNNRIPDWASFLIWAGWWMRRAQVKNVRIFMVLLLPTRICCSAICSFGAIIGSLGQSKKALTWEQICSLPSGTEVFTTLPEKGSKLIQLKGKLGNQRNEGGQKVRELIIETHIKKFKDSIFLILEKNPYQYPLTLTQQRRRFNDIYNFYKNIIAELNLSTILAIHNECLIITNQAGWKRDICTLQAAASDQSEPIICDLDLLLMPSAKDEGAQSGILISSQRPSHIIGENMPLAILEGPESLKNWELIRTQNIMILMDQAEYDENSKGILANLTSVRNDALLPMPEGIPLQPPPGIEMMMFALEAREV